jgi:hypothetical protein
MKAIGRKGGKGRRRIGERVPELDEGLIEALRGLNVELVKATAEELLGGANQTAKVAIIRLLADLQPFSRGECEVCKAQEQDAPDIEAKLISLLGRKHDEYLRERSEILREELSTLAEYAPDEAIARVEQRIADRLWPPVALASEMSLSEDSHLCIGRR